MATHAVPGTGLELILNAAEGVLQIVVTEDEAILCAQEWYRSERATEILAPALAELETLEFWERGSYIQPISRTCLTRTSEGTRVELELYHEEVYQEQAGPELLEQARAILEEYGVGGWAGFSGHDPNVLDGSSFRLEATLADGTRIEAHGENKFPPNYRDVMSALDALTAAAQKNALQQYTP